MKVTTTTTSSSIDQAGITRNLTATDDVDGYGNPVPDRDARTGKNTGKLESELCAAARGKGLTLKELAALMGVSYGHLCSVSNGRRPWSPVLREKVKAVLGEVPGQGVVYRQDGVVRGGESTYLRERARGMTLRQVADRAGLTYGYVVQVSRGHRNLSPAAQARMESVLEAPVKVETAQPADVNPQALWERMDAHGWSQNETARRAGISNGYLSDVTAGKRTPSGDVLGRRHGVLFAPSAAELVAPVELRVLGWKKGGRNGMVTRGAGGPGGESIRVGGRVPWGAEVQFAYTTGYNSHGRVSVNHVVDERDSSVMLKQADPDAV